MVRHLVLEEQITAWNDSPGGGYALMANEGHMQYLWNIVSQPKR